MKNSTFHILRTACVEFLQSAKGFWPLWLLAAFLLALCCLLSLLDN